MIFIQKGSRSSLLFRCLTSIKSLPQSTFYGSSNKIVEIKSTLNNSRSASFFSNLRFKRFVNIDKESYENVDADNSGWLDVIDEIKTKSPLRLDEQTNKLSRAELRKWKKRAFLYILEMFIQRSGKSHKGYSEFVQNALNKMGEYEVRDDLDSYKAILHLFPVKRMVVTRFLQAELGHFDRQQHIMIKVIQQMTDNQVLPDDEVGSMIIDVFGWRSHAMQHYRQVMYWTPKLYHNNPWPIPFRINDDLDMDPARLAKHIAERVCPNRMTEFTLVQLPNTAIRSNRTTALISAQSPEQRALLLHCTNSVHNVDDGVGDNVKTKPIYLDGPHYVWYRTLQGAYYTLWTEIDFKRLKREVDSVEKRLKVNNFGIEESWDLKFFNSSAEFSDLVSERSVHNHTQISCSASTDLDNLVCLSNKLIKKAEPEFDNRWSGLRLSHQYKYLPSSLVEHEQGEGTILAIAVVVPSLNALDNQKTLYDWETNNCVFHAEASGGPTSIPNQVPPDIATVPSPASSKLIHLWLNELKHTNPSFDNSTLVIRVPMNTDVF